MKDRTKNEHEKGEPGRHQAHLELKLRNQRSAQSEDTLPGAPAQGHSNRARHARRKADFRYEGIRPQPNRRRPSYHWDRGRR